MPQGYTMGSVMPLVGGATDPMCVVTASHCPLSSCVTLLALPTENATESFSGHWFTGQHSHLVNGSVCLVTDTEPPDPAVTTSGGPQGDISHHAPADFARVVIWCSITMMIRAHCMRGHKQTKARSYSVAP